MPYKQGGMWYTDVYVRGKRVRKAAGPSKHEATRMEVRMRAAAGVGKAYVPLEDLFRAYRKSLAARAKISSLRQADVHMHAVSRHFGEEMDASQLTVVDLEEYIKARLKVVSRSTVNGELTDLRAAYRYAVAAGLMDELPVQVKLLKVTRKLPVVYTSEQVNTIIDAAKEPFDLILLLAWKTGFRHQEILHLQLEDVVLNGPGSVVRATSKDGWTLKDYEEREVSLTPDGRLYKRLEEHLQGLNAKNPTSWLFPGPEGPRRSAIKQVRKAFQDAGLYVRKDKPGLHSLRKTWATDLLGKGVDIETVRQLGGWADLDTVMNYVTSTDDRKARAIALLEDD